MITVAILTISDSSHEGTRDDLSGPQLRARCTELGWTLVETRIVPDEADIISAVLRRWADTGSASLILTTGGTGLAERDVTPEATKSVVERDVPGLGELMRAKGMEQTPFSVLSRAVAGIRSKTLIINLPGSPKGALHSLGAIEEQIKHAVRLLQGQTGHSAD